jgi:hypothetical protein
LHLAVQTQRTDIVKLLLIKGANRTLKTQVSNVNMVTVLDCNCYKYVDGLIEWLFYINHFRVIPHNHGVTSVLCLYFCSVV